MKPCPKCDQSFDTGPELGAHVRAHKDEPTADAAPTWCYRCDSLFPLAQGFLDHDCPNPDDKAAAYERNIESLKRMGFEPRIDSKGVTGWHRV